MIFIHAMNNNYSKSYLPRWLAPQLKAMAAEARVTVVTGARQVGKSTLLSHELGQEWGRFDLDDPDVQDQAQRQPELLLGAARQMILDEAHLLPELFPLIKRAVDRDRTRRFVLSGSANLLLLAKTTESLAGRAEFLHLLPLAAGELARQPVPDFLARGPDLPELAAGENGMPIAQEKLAAMVWRGGMPEIAHRHDAPGIVRWREGYLRSYLEKDLHQLSQIDSLPDFKRLMSLAAWRCGRLLNQSELARDAGLSQPTAHRHLCLLEVSEQCCRLPPFHPNAAKSIVKTPKLMWTDTGVAAQAAGYHSADALAGSREWGAFLECYVFNQLRAACGTWNQAGEIFFWRTRTGKEVDFVIRHGRRLLAVEVKASQGVRLEDTVGLQEFMRLHPDCNHGLVLYAGGEQRVLAKNILAVPMSRLMPVG